MADPDYDDLKARADGEWLTYGPNSGGVEGFLLVEDQIWWFRAEWEPWVHDVPMPVAEFLERYGDSQDRGYKDAVAWLRAR